MISLIKKFKLKRILSYHAWIKINCNLSIVINEFESKLQKSNKVNKIVVYTAIFGGKDNLIDPKYISRTCDYVCFTDGDFKSEVWQVRKVIPSHQDPIRCAKKYKILPHRFLGQYDYSVWVDGNFIIRGNMNKLMGKYLKNCNFAVYDHSQNKGDPRNCIYKEAEAILKMAEKGTVKDDPQLVTEQIKKYRKLGYPENNGLTSNAILVRKHNESDVIKSMEDWWTEIENHSRRDQLSFNYVAWKNNLKFSYIPGDSRNNDFFLHTRHLK